MGVKQIPGVVVADPGYWHTEQMEGIVSRGMQVLIPPESRLRDGPRVGWDGGYHAFMRRVLDTDHAQAIYKKRQATVEPVFGQIKHNRGIDRFQRRGRSAVRSEWRLAAATHNLHQAPHPPDRHRGPLRHPGAGPIRAGSHPIHPNLADPVARQQDRAAAHRSRGRPPPAPASVNCLPDGHEHQQARPRVPRRRWTGQSSSELTAAPVLRSRRAPLRRQDTHLALPVDFPGFRGIRGRRGSVRLRFDTSSPGVRAIPGLRIAPAIAV